MRAKIMNVKIFAGIGLGIGLAALTGCAPPVTWERTGTTPAQYSMDIAQCQLVAEGMNPDPGTDRIKTGKVGRDIAVNLAEQVVHGMVQGAAVSHTFDLCMEGRGYMAAAPSVAPPAQPIAPVALSSPQAPLPAAISSLTPASTNPMHAAGATQFPPLGPCGYARPCYSEPIIVATY